MDGTGFLKTINFGGFDKKDVLAYVDQLNTKIYTLENELEESERYHGRKRNFVRTADLPFLCW